jgi:hypothetical protein
MRFDAEASMRCWGVVLDIGGHDYAIPPLPAGPWLTAITAPTYRRIVPGMVRGLSMDDLLDQMVAGRVRISDLDVAARNAIEEIAGTKWWSAVRLSSWLIGNWHTLGSAVLSRGMNMSADPLGAVLVVAYRVILENCKDEQERQKIDIELDLAPRGVSAEEMFDPVAASAAFMALADAPE